MNQRNPLILPLIMAVLLVLVLAVTTLLFYGRYKDASTDLNIQIDQAVTEAEQQQAAELEAEFAQKEKSPYETYVSPSELSSVAVTYPKTWSSHVIEESGGNLALDGYFHPGTVPGTDGSTLMALRLTLESASYGEEVANYNQDVDDGLLKAKTIKINGVSGIRYDGQIEEEVNGALVLLPIRDKTLKIWTESTNFIQDFTDIILKNLKFSP